MEVLIPAVFVLGLAVGSFLNVCIYRVPRRLSVVSPPSACPSCSARIRPLHNIPVVSYVLLRGRCAYCGSGISVRYPLVELLNAVLYAAALWRFGPTAKAAVAMLLLSAFVVVTFIDLEHRIIPDGITIPGLALGLVLGPLVFGTGVAGSLIGAMLGGGLFFIIAVISRGGMGGGDIKFIAMVGAFLGWKGVLVTIFFGSALGAAVGVSLMAFAGLKRKTPIPFGPFLVAGAALTMFFGAELIEWYGGMWRLP